MDPRAALTTDKIQRKAEHGSDLTKKSYRNNTKEQNAWDSRHETKT